MDRKGQMVSVRFTETASIDPEKLMQLVARNAKRGAQFTPQGVLRFPVKATQAAEVLDELRRLIETLAAPLIAKPSTAEVSESNFR
jgi:transcription-repair coupling factor (superfamily II helicase)